MKPDRRILFAVLLAAVSGLAVSCDRPDGGGGVAGPAAPQYSVSPRNFKALRTSEPLNKDHTWSTSVPIGSRGGGLRFADNSSLVVQKNSVSQPTHFSATVKAGDEIHLELRAWLPDGTPVTQFKVPVMMYLDLSKAELAALGIDDISKIIVVYHAPSGELEVQPTRVDVKSRKVTVTLSHFSDYTPGWSREAVEQ